MFLALEGDLAGTFYANEWYNFPILGKVGDARFVPYWWSTLARYHRVLKSHAERGAYDNEKQTIALDTRIFTDPAWVKEWYDERSGVVEQQVEEEANQTSMAW